MKVSSDHLETLRGWALQQMKDDNISKEDWETLYEGITEQTKLWGFYWFATKSAIASRTVRPLFYGYEDKQIETALRKLYKEIE